MIYSAFQCIYLPSLYLLWWNVCTTLMPRISKIRSFFFLLSSCKSSLYILNITPWPDKRVYFLPVHDLPCHFLNGLMKSNFFLNFYKVSFFFLFMIRGFCVLSKKSLLPSRSQLFFSAFLLRHFTVLTAVIFRGVIHF